MKGSVKVVHRNIRVFSFQPPFIQATLIVNFQTFSSPLFIPAPPIISYLKVIQKLRAF